MQKPFKNDKRSTNFEITQQTQSTTIKKTSVQSNTSVSSQYLPLECTIFPRFPSPANFEIPQNLGSTLCAEFLHSEEAETFLGPHTIVLQLKMSSWWQIFSQIFQKFFPFSRIVIFDKFWGITILVQNLNGNQ